MKLCKIMKVEVGNNIIVKKCHGTDCTICIGKTAKIVDIEGDTIRFTYGYLPTICTITKGKDKFEIVKEEE